MKAAPFKYLRPESLEEALEALAEHGEECRPLAGGQSLIPLLAMRLAQPAVIVDLGRIPRLRGFDGLHIGAMTTNSDLERQPETMPPVVVAALPHIGHFQIRNRGTVGGALAHCDPAAEWPALALALAARITLRSARGERIVDAADFITGPLTTAIAPDELLIEVELPAWARSARFGFEEVARRPGDFALAGAVCVAGPDGRRLVLFAGGEVPVLLADPNSPFTVTGDLNAGRGYRRRLAEGLLKRAWEAAA